jgi:hypothetical protein
MVLLLKVIQKSRRHRLGDPGFLIRLRSLPLGGKLLEERRELLVHCSICLQECAEGGKVLELNRRRRSLRQRGAWGGRSLSWYSGRGGRI